MNAKTIPDIETGRIVFGYMRDDQFVLAGKALRDILRKEPLSDVDVFTIDKGHERKEYHRYTARIGDLTVEQLKNLGHAASRTK